MFLNVIQENTSISLSQCGTTALRVTYE